MPAREQTRDAYGRALLELGRSRDDVLVLDADLYKSTRTHSFAEAFPTRFLDMGIAEADMVSTAAGLAASGLIPYCNSFAIFLTGRCYGQIRVQVAYPRLNVKLVGSSAGLTQGPDGASHQSLEDISLMRGLPNMAVVVPADDVETKKATRAIAEWPGPVYMRVGRYPTPRVFEEDYKFEVGRAVTVRDGGDVGVLATGHMVAKALEAARLLGDRGIEARVLNVSTLKPLDREAVVAATEGTSLAVTVEEHSIYGGLGSAVAEVMAEECARCRLLRIGVEDVFGESGSGDELLAKHGLTAEGIAGQIRHGLERGRSAHFYWRQRGR
jgi:transketolase